MTCEQTEVLVAGGGSAGLAAAIAAARLGASVLVVERHGFLGGMGTAALVHSVCGLYRITGEGETPVLANPGIPSEMAHRILSATGQSAPVRMGKLDVLPQHPHLLARIADRWVAETAGLRVWFHCELTAVEQAGAGWEARLMCRGQSIRVKAAALIDASGDAELATALGGRFEMTEPANLQRPAYVFGLAGVDPEAVTEPGRLRLAHRLTKLVRSGDLAPTALGARFSPVPGSRLVFVTLDLAAGQEAFDPADPDCLTGIEIEGRNLAQRITVLLRHDQAGFGAAEIACWPARAGIRESRRWIGRYQLTGEDILAGRRFEDEVALATWPLEMRQTARGARLRFADDGKPSGIAMGCLQPRELENVFVAGRCISADHDAQASIRVMGTCLATGQAAGQAAAQR